MSRYLPKGFTLTSAGGGSLLHGHLLAEVSFSCSRGGKTVALSTSAPRHLPALVHAFKQVVLLNFLSSFYSCFWQGSWSYKSYSIKDRSGNKWNKIVRWMLHYK